MRERYDAIVIGGGPTGATAGLVMARRGLKVLIVERAKHPRFHIGESFMPHMLRLFQELGLSEELSAIPHVHKVGAEFSLGHELRKTAFRFEWGFPVGAPEAFNIERAPFDAMLLRAARESGAVVLEKTTVRQIDALEDGHVSIATDRDAHEGSYLVDASGTHTVLGRHLGTRRVLPGLKKVAFFGHFHGVRRKPGLPGGYVAGVLCKEGWFMLIPIDERRTSIGLVMDVEAAREVGIPSDQMLAWGIRRCPEMAFRCEEAVFPASNGVTSDFSYTYAPYAGPGYFLAGDAATFVDPIFSTGITLGMTSAMRAGEHIERIVRFGASPAKLRADYNAAVQRTADLFFRLVYAYYDHSFRELFLHGYGPLETHRAIISILAGHVFPPDPRLLRRLALLQAFIMLQRFVPLVPRRDTFSLLEGRTVPPERRLEWRSLFPAGEPPLLSRLRALLD